MNTNTNTMELNMDKMEKPNGGWDWLLAAMGAVTGGFTSAAVAGCIASAACLASGPAVWVVLAGAVIGGGALAAVAGSQTLPKPVNNP